MRRKVNPTESIYWDGKDSSGEIQHSGIYIWQIKVGSKIYNGQVVLAK